MLQQLKRFKTAAPHHQYRIRPSLGSPARLDAVPSLNVSSNPKPFRRDLHEYKSQMNSTFIYMDPANATPATQGHKDVKHRYSSSRRRQRLRHRLRWRGFGTAAIGLLRRTCFQGSSPDYNRNIQIILILILVIVVKVVNNCWKGFGSLSGLGLPCQTRKATY